MSKAPEEMTDAELRAAAETEAAEPAEKPVEAAKPAEPVVVGVDMADTPDVTVFRRVIDIGEGAGPEVFEAESLEELVDKIAEAKGNATRKIREQQHELNERRAKDKPPQPQVTPEDEVILSQELMKNPTKAIREWFKRETGYPIEEFRTVKQATDAIKEAGDRNAAADRFIATHPDYKDSTRNGDLIAMYLKSEGLKSTSENFHQAYLSLSKSGLLELKPQEENVGTEQKEPKEERIAQPKVTEVTTQRTKKSSGISTHARPSVAANQEPSEDEAYKMPLEDLKALANRQLATR